MYIREGEIREVMYEEGEERGGSRRYGIEKLMQLCYWCCRTGLGRLHWVRRGVRQFREVMQTLGPRRPRKGRRERNNSHTISPCILHSSQQ